LPDVDGIRIKAGDDVTIEDCVFVGLGGIAVVSNTTTHRLTIVNNEIASSGATAMYLGCHDGVSCRVTDAVIERNHIHGVEAPPPQIGYGVQVKLNSTAVLRDNVIVNTKGPGIMVYGADDPAFASLVEGNLVAHARTAAGVVIGGGPAIVQNNIVIGGGEAGIALEDYGRRRLLRGVRVANNTVYAALKGGITLDATGPVDVKLLYNAAHALTGRAFPGVRFGVTSLGNVDCRSAACFVDPAALDFAPRVGSPLPGRAQQAPGVPRDDFFGSPRPAAGSIGAVESGSRRPVTLGKKPSRG
jgi:hypothetical protein